MSFVAEKLEAMDVPVTSPDGAVTVRVTGSGVKALEFQPGAYRNYSEAALEQQLLTLARLTVVAWRRERLKILSRQQGREIKPGSVEPDGSAKREFRERSNKVVAHAKTAHLKVSGGRGGGWEVRIRPGTLETLDERQFLKELGAAVGSMLADMRYQFRRLREELYGVRYPAVGIFAQGSRGKRTGRTTR